MFKTLALAGFLGASLFCTHVHARDVAIGDSIALGTGRALHVATFARTSMGSCWILRNEVIAETFDNIVVSAGINDPPGKCVRTIFATLKFRGKLVVILPAPINSARHNVEVAAVQFGGYPISYACKGKCTKSNFHPGSYAAVAHAVRSIWGH